MEASNKRNTKSGFTLVEMLTVIVIIGILAGLITAAAVPAIRAARRATIQTEMTQLGIALEKYKTERGDLPPDFAGVYGGPSNNATLQTNAQATVLRHFRKAFPRYTPGACPGCPALMKNKYTGLIYDIGYATRSDPGNPSTGMNLINTQFDPARALVFMLGGPPAPEGTSPKLLGFSANPANPFAQGGSRLPSALAEFDETRIQVVYNNNGVPTSLAVFIPPHMPQPSSGNKAPYVYFRPKNRKYLLPVTSELPYFWQSSEQGICMPYAQTVVVASGAVTSVTRWAEPTKFQIICAGLDGLYSAPTAKPSDSSDVALAKVHYLQKPDGGYITPEEDDNLTSFTQGQLADRPEE